MPSATTRKDAVMADTDAAAPPTAAKPAFVSKLSLDGAATAAAPAPFSRSQPAAAATASASPAVFPRGRSTGLTALENRTIKTIAVAKALFSESDAAQAASAHADGASDDGHDDLPEIAKRAAKRAKVQLPASHVLDRGGKKAKPSAATSQDRLEYRMVTVGTQFLATVQRVTKMQAIVDLPRHMTAVLPITEISTAVTAAVERAAGGDDDADDDEEAAMDLDVEIPDVADYVAAGETVLVSVVHVDEEAAKSSKKAKKVAPRAEVSIRPDIVNRHLSGMTLLPGFAMMASVASVEDHGYLMDLGFTTPSGENVRGFVAANVEAGATWPVGKTLLVHTTQPASNPALLTLAAGLPMTPYNDAEIHVKAIQPGLLIPAVVSEPVSDDQPYAAAMVLGSLRVAIDVSQIPVGTTLTTGAQLPVRLIAIHEGLRAQASVLPHWVDADAAAASAAVQQAIPTSSFVRGVITSLSPDSGLAMLVEPEAATDGAAATAADDAAFAAAALADPSRYAAGSVKVVHIADEKLPEARIAALFHVGQVVRARVLGYAACDRHYALSTQPSVLAQSCLVAKDVAVGAVFRATTVTAVAAAGITVQLSDRVTAFVPRSQCSDTGVDPSRLFTVGKKNVTVRILQHLPGEGLIATVRPGLVKATGAVLTDPSEFAPHLIVTGFVSAVKDNFFLVEFYNRCNACVGRLDTPLSQPLDGELLPLDTKYRRGQIITVRLKSRKGDKLFATVDLTVPAGAAAAAKRRATEGGSDAPPCNAGRVHYNPETAEVAVEEAKQRAADLAQAEHVAVGTAVTATVVCLTRGGVYATFDYVKGAATQSALGFLTVAHLADHPADARRLHDRLAVGSTLAAAVFTVAKDAAAPAKDAARVMLTARPLLLRLPTPAPLTSLAQMKEGDEVPAVLTTIEAKYVLFRTYNDVGGIVLLSGMADEFVSNPAARFVRGQSVVVRLVNVDAAGHRLEGALKDSMAVLNGRAEAIYLGGRLETACAVRTQREATLVAAYPVGKRVETVLDGRAEHGYTGSLTKSIKSLLVTTAEHAAGDAVAATVVDVDAARGCVICVPVPAAAAKPRRAAAKPLPLEPDALVSSRVVHIADEYLVVAVERPAKSSTPPPPTYAKLAIARFPAVSALKTRFRLDQVIPARVVEVDGPSGAPLLVRHRMDGSADGVSAEADLLARRKDPINAIDAAVKTWDDLAPGCTIDVAVRAVRPSALMVRVADNVLGYISGSQVREITDTEAASQTDAPCTDAVRPFVQRGAFRPKQILRATVVGYRHVRTHQTLALSHKQGMMVLDLTLKPSLTETMQDPAVGTGMIISVAENRLLVTMDDAKHTTGAVCLFDATRHVDALKDLHTFFQVGQLVRYYKKDMEAADDVFADAVEDPSTAAVTAAGKNGGDAAATGASKLPKLSLLPPTVASDGHATFDVELKMGTTVLGCISKVSKASLLVTLPGGMTGTVSWYHLGDTLNLERPTKGFAVHHVMHFYVLSVHTNAKGETLASLSLRPSLTGFADELAAVVGAQAAKHVAMPVVDRMAALSMGDRVVGAVESASEKGVFLRLSRDLIGYVSPKQCSDLFIRDIARAFPVGLHVQAAVVGLNADKNHILLSTAASRLGTAMLTYDDVQINENYTGMITLVKDFGCFVRLDQSTVEGLVHISHCADVGEALDAAGLAAAFHAGDRVSVHVLKKNAAKKQLSFSMRSSYFDEDDEEEEAMDSDAEDADAMLHADSDSENEDEEASDAETTPEDAAMADHTFEDAVDDEAGLLRVGAHVPALDVDWDDELEVLNVRGADLDALAAETHADVDADADADDAQVEGVDASDSDAASDAEATATAGTKRKRSSKTSSRARRAAKQAHAEDVSRKEAERLSAAAPQSIDDYERLVVSSPNASLVWVHYMAFHLKTSQVPMARTTAERALKVISVREEAERFNVMQAWLNLELAFGTEATLAPVLSRAMQSFEPLKVLLHVANVYEKKSDTEKAQQTYDQLIKKCRDAPETWIQYGQFLFRQGQAKAAQSQLEKALKSVDPVHHVALIQNFARSDYVYGHREHGITLFESLISQYPKRTDIWNVYLDQEARGGAERLESVRRLYHRVLTNKLSTKKGKALFKKWLQYENQYGDAKGVDAVRQAALAYVERWGK